MATEETQPEPTMAQVLARLADIAAANTVVQQEQVKQTRRKSLDFGPNISQFNLRGEKDFPMPLLKCECYAPWKNTPTLHSFTREEVELWNRLVPGAYTLELNDGATIQVNVVGVMNTATGELEKLSLLGGKEEDGRFGGLFTQENKQQFPSLVVMLRQFLDQKDIEHGDILTMKKEAALIKSGALAVSVGE